LDTRHRHIPEPPTTTPADPRVCQLTAGYKTRLPGALLGRYRVAPRCWEMGLRRSVMGGQSQTASDRNAGSKTHIRLAEYRSFNVSRQPKSAIA
jgi:hypothetical protein